MVVSHQFVACFDGAVGVAFFGRDASALHGRRLYPHFNGGLLIKPLILITARIHQWQMMLRQHFIGGIYPHLPNTLNLLHR